MAKPLQEEDEPKSVPFLVYLKAFFLVGAIAFGMSFLSKAAERQQLEKKDSQKEASSSSSLRTYFSKEKIQEKIDNEIRTNEAYKYTVNAIETQRDRVLGEATKAADMVIEKSKQTFFDYVYEHTVGAVIEQMVERMPEEQKEKLLEKVEE